MSANPDFNISIWSVITQIICLVYYLGYGLSAFFRHVASELIVQNDFEEFKNKLIQSSQFFFILLLILFVVVFTLARELSKCFFDDLESIYVMEVCLRILSPFFVTEGFVAFLNSVLRLIGNEFFVMLVSLILFMILLPLSSFMFTYMLQTGTVVILLNFVGISLFISLLFAFRMKKTAEINFHEAHKNVKSEHDKNLQITINL